MGTDWIQLRQAFPWLGKGFIHAVAEVYADEFCRALASLGFTVATMHPGSADEFHDHLAAALNFPASYGRNWDATHDCFRDVAIEHPFALVWRGADTIASTDPKLFAEAASVLSRELEGLGGRNTQAVLVITGSGEPFRRPPASP